MHADPEDRPRRSPARPPSLKREARLFLIVGGFGIVLLPALVYLAGSLTLGPYDGGIGPFLAILYRDVASLSPAALALVLGPYVIFQLVRWLTRPFRHGRRR